MSNLIHEYEKLKISAYKKYEQYSMRLAVYNKFYNRELHAMVTLK
jgi:hypothetical protein